MPKFCLVLNCSHDTSKRKDLSFCRVPKIVTRQGEETEILSTERRRRWLTAISRDDLTDKILENDRVCGEHFHSGIAAPLWDKWNVDWVPSLKLGHEKLKVSEASVQQSQERVRRATERTKRMVEKDSENSQISLAKKRLKHNEAGHSVQNISFDVEMADIEDISENLPDNLRHAVTQTELSCNTVLSPEPIHQNLPSSDFDEAFFSGDDDKVKFYTGLPSFEILQTVFFFVASHVDRRRGVLTKFQEFCMVLVKLRLSVPHLDLAYRLKISTSSVSRILVTWITVMDIRLTPIIKWPSRDELYKTMPRCFLDAFGRKTTVIIDCFEIFIDRPSNLLARAQTFSNYKHHNTVKVLIGVTPQGTICFVSEAWGGRTSDKFLTEKCGILEKLLPGDMVLADRGFTVHESIWFRHADLNIPAFTKGKDQLDPVDVEKTRQIATLRIHVERIIGTLRQKYTILQQTLPTDYLACRSGESVPLIDRMLRVCSALVNLCPPTIPFD
ncbi:uncharacterized protein LOC111334730 [Stylophora pistillata]|uniref:uncharacterized protein LOC111334729 n=1 Tax=Stylophora pistillata TaxID=50429 RepID=UPI000C056EED|nr:uncharacterized protein LOC111334729 [Stylophora pistillata]XP_022796276.1 uncharacterized protein LOC111334730 [Stylophora pistillata]